MPTIASLPTLENTQAIGAVLLHQFARQRFIDAGVDEKYIQDAEKAENLDNLTSVLLSEEEEKENENDDTTTRDITLSSDDNSCMINSINSDRENDSTLTLQNSSNGHNISANTTEQYISMAASNSTTSTTCNLTTSTMADYNHAQDNTVYHSIDGGLKSNTIQTKSTTLDKIELLPDMAFYGKQLRMIAEEFEKTQLRQQVKTRAGEVELSKINKASFIELLEQLFEGGITRERIVILFFFCTDVALRAVSFGQELVVKLIQWSFSYIIETVCRIVHSIGGWNKELGLSSMDWDSILFKQLPSVLISCCAALGILALVTHLNKSLRA